MLLDATARQQFTSNCCQPWSRRCPHKHCLLTSPFVGGRRHGQGAEVRSNKGVEWVDMRCFARPGVTHDRRTDAQTDAPPFCSCAASRGWGSPVTTPVGDTPKGVCGQA